MYEGTLYGHWQAIVTLQQMLVLCNSEGVVDMTPQAMSARTSIPLEIIQKGIEVLSQPDPYTRTPGEEGKRIVLIEDHRPWGWYIVNYKKYQKLKSHQEKLEADRTRIADKRKLNKNSDVADSRNASQPVADVAHVAVPKAKPTPKDKEASGKPDLKTLIGLGVDEQAAKDWLVVRKAKHAPLTASALDELKAEACKAGIDVARAVAICAKRSWQGFNASWNWQDTEGVNGKAVIAWWSSNEGIQAKAVELGINIRPGESWGDLKARVSAQLGAS